MILVRLTKEDNGVISSVSSIGHDAGNDGIVCSAISSLLRTFAVCLEQKRSVQVKGKALNRGEFYCVIEKYSKQQLEWIKGLSDYLITGLDMVKQEYPEDVTIVFDT